MSPDLWAGDSIATTGTPKAMNAFFFTAGITEYVMRPAYTGNFRPPVDRLETVDTCASIIVYGGDRDVAQKEFEKWINSVPEQEKPVQTEIKRILAAPMVDQLFTEYGHEAIDWPQISEKADANLNAVNVDNFEQGYWADVNQIVAADKLAVDVESLRRELPEEIHSGLNWSHDKTFFFLVSVLSPPVLSKHVSQESETINLRTGEICHAEPPEKELQKSESEPSIYPQLVEKKAVALVLARNSVIAAWLWRNFTAEKELPADEIRIDPWCGAIPINS